MSQCAYRGALDASRGVSYGIPSLLYRSVASSCHGRSSFLSSPSLAGAAAAQAIRTLHNNTHIKLRSTSHTSLCGVSHHLSHNIYFSSASSPPPTDSSSSSSSSSFSSVSSSSSSSVPVSVNDVQPGPEYENVDTPPRPRWLPEMEMPTTKKRRSKKEKNNEAQNQEEEKEKKESGRKRKKKVTGTEEKIEEKTEMKIEENTEVKTEEKTEEVKPEKKKRKSRKKPSSDQEPVATQPPVVPEEATPADLAPPLPKEVQTQRNDTDNSQPENKNGDGTASPAPADSTPSSSSSPPAKKTRSPRKPKSAGSSRSSSRGSSDPSSEPPSSTSPPSPPPSASSTPTPSSPPPPPSSPPSASSSVSHSKMLLKLEELLSDSSLHSSSDLCNAWLAGGGKLSLSSPLLSQAVPHLVYEQMDHESLIALFSSSSFHLTKEGDHFFLSRRTPFRPNKTEIQSAAKYMATMWEEQQMLVHLGNKGEESEPVTATSPASNTHHTPRFEDSLEDIEKGEEQRIHDLQQPISANVETCPLTQQEKDIEQDTTQAQEKEPASSAADAAVSQPVSVSPDLKTGMFGIDPGVTALSSRLNQLCQTRQYYEATHTFSELVRLYPEDVNARHIQLVLVAYEALQAWNDVIALWDITKKKAVQSCQQMETLLEQSTTSPSPATSSSSSSPFPSHFHFSDVILDILLSACARIPKGDIALEIWELTQKLADLHELLMQKFPPPVSATPADIFVFSSSSSPPTSTSSHSSFRVSPNNPSSLLTERRYHAVIQCLCLCEQYEKASEFDQTIRSKYTQFRLSSSTIYLLLTPFLSGNSPVGSASRAWDRMKATSWVDGLPDHSLLTRCFSQALAEKDDKVVVSMYTFLATEVPGMSAQVQKFMAPALAAGARLGDVKFVDEVLDDIMQV